MNSIVEPALERLARATSAVSSLDTWPATYQGRVPVDADRSTADLSSGRFRERSAALEELKLRATLAGFDIVYRVRYEEHSSTETEYHGTRRDGSLITSSRRVTLWVALGVAAHRSRRAKPTGAGGSRTG